MKPLLVPFWKKAPFFRLLVALIAGILLQWYLSPPVRLWLAAGSISMIMLALSAAPRISGIYRLASVAGAFVFLLTIATGGTACYFADVRHKAIWIGNVLRKNDTLVVSVPYPFEEKARSWKTIAFAEYILRNGSAITVTGKLYLYIGKRAAVDSIPPGALLQLDGDIGQVPSSGNPAAFDYKRYSLYQGITHQQFLRGKDLHMVGVDPPGWVRGFLPALQQRVLKIVRTWIPGRREAGLAAALLIGYKQDLDPDLVSDYTDTGLAHVIAISGMHLALIYWLLMMVFRPLGKRRGFRIIAPALTITCLWIFTLLAGAQPSVLRSAVMFTCIITGRTISRNQTIYNSLAASAFILLCYNPFWLWDLGFQLSYAAVLSLLIFMKPVSQWFIFSNRLVHITWNAMAVSIAAQVLTTPLSIYHFHQFPNYFLLSNLVAVPLSTVILFGEIILCAVSFVEPVAKTVGEIIACLMRFLNGTISHLAGLPFATWELLRISILQAALLYVAVAILYYTTHRNLAPAATSFLAVLLVFTCLRTFSFYEAGRQKALVIYQVPGKTVAGFISGRRATIYGDQLTGREYNFHIRPSAINQRFAVVKYVAPVNGIACFRGDTSNVYLVSNKVQGLLPGLLDSFKAGNSTGATTGRALVVLDSSVPAWQAGKLKAMCRSAHVAVYSIAEQGALVLP